MLKYLRLYLLLEELVYMDLVSDVTNSMFIIIELYTGGDKNTGTKMLDFKKHFIHNAEQNLQYLFQDQYSLKKGYIYFIDADFDRVATNVDNKPGGFILYYE